jgi:hypothetical protein
VKQIPPYCGREESGRRNLFDAAENLCHSVEASQPNALKREAWPASGLGRPNALAG